MFFSPEDYNTCSISSQKDQVIKAMESELTQKQLGLLSVCNDKKSYYCIGGKGMWFDPRLEYFRLKFDREREKSKIEFNHIFDQGMEKKITEPLKFTTTLSQDELIFLMSPPGLIETAISDSIAHTSQK